MPRPRTQLRPSGEWQIEWHVLPQVSCLTAGALRISTRIVAGLAVHPERMAVDVPEPVEEPAQSQTQSQSVG